MLRIQADLDGNGIADMEIIVNNNTMLLPARISSSSGADVGADRRARDDRDPRAGRRRLPEGE